MRAGTLRRRLIIESPDRQRDSYGQNSPVWQELATVFASINPLSGKQLAMALARTITSTATHEIRMRYTRQIPLKVGVHRLKVVAESGRPRIFTLNAVLDVDDRHREWVLTCTEVVA